MGTLKQRRSKSSKMRVRGAHPVVELFPSAVSFSEVIKCLHGDRVSNCDDCIVGFNDAPVLIPHLVNFSLYDAATETALVLQSVG